MISSETARRLAHEALPELDLDALEPLAGGHNSAVFASADVVVKVYSELLHWKLRKELLVYRLLAEHDAGVPVARVVHADDERRVLVLTRLEGQLLEPLARTLDEEQRAAINRQVGSILARLHAIRFDAFGYVGTDGIVEPHPTNAEYMSFQFEKKLREFRDLGGDAAIHGAISRTVEKRRRLFTGCERAVFCHNDCHSENLLVVPSDDGWRISGLLDLENVLAGDPLLDLAKAHCYDRRRSEQTLAALVAGYGRLRDHWREALDLYVVYHWLELWDWFAATGTREPLPALEEELNRLTAKEA
ncbi:MAG TPA: phosphotransferase [Gaiellaceae bacterium]